MTTRNGHFPVDARAAAALYLQRGLAPIPLPTRSKDPGFDGWTRLRITDEALDEHFPSGETKNIALLNGDPSGRILDVDLDCPEALTAARHLLPSTGWRFGRKSAPGSHWLYRADQALDRSQLAFRDLDKNMLVELRGNKGISVLPPSLHKETGERITWEQFDEPGEVSLADLRRAVGEVAACSLLARHWPAKGSRDEAALALAGGLARAGWDVEKIETFLLATAEAAGDEEARSRAAKAGRTAEKLLEGKKATGWVRLAELLQGGRGPAVVQQVRTWLGLTGSRKEKGKVRMIPPYTPFPVEVLPRPLSIFVEQGAKALGCDPSFVALPTLAVVAAVIGNTRTIRLKRTWSEPSIVWSAIVGYSGSLKSPAYSLAMAPLFELENQLRKQHERDLDQYKKDKAAWEDEGKEGAPPQEPTEKRLLTSDTTIERLCELLEDNPRGLLVARDELAGWLSSFTRYKSSSDLPAWLEAHRAGTMLVDRKTTAKKRLFVHRAAVSITGGIQPDILTRALTSEHFDAGLAARLLLAWPPRTPKSWNEVEVEDAVIESYQDLLDGLLALGFDSLDDEKIPHRLRLSHQAKAAWIAFYNGWAGKQAAVEGELAAAFSKLEAYAARFALLHHVVEHVQAGADDRVEVELVSVEAGITLAHWFAREAERVYAMMRESDTERDTRKLVEAIQKRGGKITARQLMRANNRAYPDTEAATAALAQLVEAGLARWVEIPAKKKGKPIRGIELCMTHDTHDTVEDGDDPDEEDLHDTVHDTVEEAHAGTGQDATACDSLHHGATSTGNRVMRVMRHAETPGENSPGNPEPADETSSATVSCTVSCSSPFRGRAGGGPSTVYPYQEVTDADELNMVLLALDQTDLVGLDLETTGLDARRDRIRLLSLALDTVDADQFAYLLDLDALGTAAITELLERLGEKNLILHTAAFDLAFLARLGFVPRGKVRDTMLLSQLLTAGTFHKNDLAACCERYLGHRPDKAMQKADWTGKLTADQLNYAAGDVLLLKPLLLAMAKQIKEAGLEAAAGIEGRALPALVWMAQHGVPLDRAAWTTLADAARVEADQLRRDLDQAAPVKPGELFDAWNWDSPPQVKQALELVGLTVEKTDDETLAALDHPLAAQLRKYRQAQKRLSVYGANWLEHVREDGRVYPNWRQIGAAPGRMSCTDPNMQQLPRGEYRRCVAAPPGRVLVKADYSQIELRIVAKVSGDQALLDAYQKGDDLHTLTAQKVLGKTAVTKADRQLAKAVNFGLVFGMGAQGFRAYARSNYNLDLTEDEARRYREAFFQSYPGLAAWHRKVKSRKTKLTRTLSGRRRLLDEKTPDTLRLNSPIQGTGADGLKQALALLWERRDQMPGAFPVLAVHDEIVIEVDEEQAQAAADWLKQAMLDGMAPLLDPVPVEVEVKIGRTWGGD